MALKSCHLLEISVILKSHLYYWKIADIKGPHNDSANRFGETRQRFAKFQKHACSTSGEYHYVFWISDRNHSLDWHEREPDFGPWNTRESRQSGIAADKSIQKSRRKLRFAWSPRRVKTSCWLGTIQTIRESLPRAAMALSGAWGNHDGLINHQSRP